MNKNWDQLRMGAICKNEPAITQFLTPLEQTQRTRFD